MIQLTEQLQERARRLALTHDVRRQRINRGRQRLMLDRQLAQLVSLAADLGAEGASCPQPAGEWLLDHAEFIEEQGYGIRQELRSGCLRGLPVIRKSGETRIEALCGSYLDETEGGFDLPSFLTYTNAYQEVAVLTNAETWTLPLALRFRLINRLGELFGEVRERHDACRQAEAILEPVLAGASRPDAGAIVAAMEQAGKQLPLSGAVIVHLVGYLREWCDDPAVVRAWLAGRLENGDESLGRLTAYEHKLQASYQMAAGRLIQSLRDAERADWEPALEAISFSERTLSGELAGSYPLMDATSRGTLRLRVAKLAGRLGVPENLVAERAVLLANRFAAPAAAQTPAEGEPPGNGGDRFSVKADASATAAEGAAAIAAANSPAAEPSAVTNAGGAAVLADGSADMLPRQAFAAYYLLEAEGAQQLRQSLKDCTSPRRLLENGLLRRRVHVYFMLLGGLFAVFAALLIAAGGYGGRLPAAGWLLLGALALLPASEWAVTALHALVGKMMPSRPLLRYDFAAGIPGEAETMVVIPVIWSKPEEVHEAADKLELHYLANRDPRLHFALLGDFADASSETTDQDEALLAAAGRRIMELNRRYSNPDDAAVGTTFHYFQRRRVWNESESVWMGWERKRGKLVEFVRLLAGEKNTGFMDFGHDRTVLDRIRYLITLDADTQLPIGSAQRMVGSIHLPFNRPRMNETRTRVTQGYGVLQPRIAISRESADKSRLAALWAGNPGIDPYAFAVSDPYQDGLGEGIFTGKGIFDVPVFRELLSARIPENRVLSHDLLEGGFLRGGLLSDIELIDGHPVTFRSYQQRLHRWVRGDWQLLCWLRSEVKDCGGTLHPVDLSAITRWQMIDNMRRSLMAPALYLLLLLGAFFPAGTRGVLLAAAVLTFFIPVVRSLFPVGNWVRHPRTAAAALMQSALTVITLPYQTVLMADAIARTLYRLGVSKRRLLEWVSSAEIDRREDGRGGAGGSIIGLRYGYALAVLYAAVSFWFAAPGYAAAAAVLSAVWLLAPPAVHYLNARPRTNRIRLTADEMEELTKLAAQIWAYYTDFAGEEDNWLPPDNVQIDPAKGTAHRTSPTNIGLMLACAVTARDFGFITTDTLLMTVERTVGTVERMEKWAGHLYNWYDTRTLAPLAPLYVSTVDSGNFVAYLITVKEGLSEWMRQDFGTNWPPEGKRLLGRLERLIADTDFRPLYDDGARLLTLGFHAGLNRRETILYDLLASEARQASFLAIALGQIPVSHWFRLGRAMTRIGRFPTLLSWSGTMFEYLMPSLIMRTYRNTVWDSTFRGVVKRQRQFASRNGVPYGISESGYYAFDHALNYQYRAFGVPGLGFQRGLERDLVLAPYAAVMALPLQVRDGLANLERLEKLGARGKYGFYEAIDCTPSRMPEGKTQMLIRSFMAHHQGMSLLTLGNLLLPRSMQQRFHADKRVRAAELLLQERIPEKAALIEAPVLRSKQPRSSAFANARPVREFTDPVTYTPEVCVLGSGSFSSVVTASGSGYIRSGKTALTRWREDPVTETGGCAVYIRNVSSGGIWSPSLYPTGVKGDNAKVRFMPDRAEFSRTDGDVDTVMEICVSSEHNAELRRLRLTNNGAAEVLLEVTTFVEITLAPPAADNAHPAFSKLFVQTALDEDSGGLLAYRRPRSPDDETLWAVHALLVDGESVGPMEFDTDRSCFIGRGHSLARPVSAAARLSGSTGPVLDPAFIIRRRLRVPPGAAVSAHMISGVAASRGEAVGIVTKLHSAQQVESAFQLAFTHSQIELRHQHLSAAEAETFHTLAAQILYTPPLRDARKKAIAANSKGQSGLWPMGISGDLPIVTVTVRDRENMGFVRRMINGHSYLRRKGVSFDLVLLNESAGGYQQDLQDELHRAVEQMSSYPPYEVPGGIYPVAANQRSEEELLLVMAVSRVLLQAGGASLTAQLKYKAGFPGRNHKATAQSAFTEHRAATGQSTHMEQAALAGTIPYDEPQAPYAAARPPVSAADLADNLQLFNGWGGFAESGSEYRILLRGGKHLQAPWSNVMANPKFGTLVTELGTGYTWYSNSREFKLTPWSNDPVLDPPGEAFYVYDEEDDRVWTAAPSPGLPGEPCQVSYARGYSRFESEYSGIRQTMTVYVPPEDPVKIVELKLRNDSGRPRFLSAAYYCSWVLGVSKDGSAPYTVTEWDGAAASLYARSGYQETFRDTTAFLLLCGDGVSIEELSWTSDRREFIGRDGSLGRPGAFGKGKLSGFSGTQYDACGAIQTQVMLDAGEERTVYAVLGAASSREEAHKLAEAFGDPKRCSRAYAETTKHWEELLGQLTVQTPDREFNLLVNGWLLYQALSCRMWARTAFYQAGGAYGFRDQLQDSLAMLHTRPDLTRSQLLLHASHQYEEGDVQHWWHEETERGIRTLYSDDLLWLPYAASRYAVHTGDWDVFAEKRPFLQSEPLRKGEHERYEATVASGGEGTLYEHCVRAIDRSLAYGEQGIPLMGIGDWNDGMNSVGDDGKGQSVWLGWFLCDVLERFAAVCERRGDKVRSVHYRKSRDKIAAAINEHAWDGQWYRRARTDEGRWLGASQNSECRIDAIAQSWSVISGGAPPERASSAMHSFDRELVDRNLALAKLLTPAFDRTDPSPGYIQGYPPGIRENGAQYTHGVIWSIVAWSVLGDGDKAGELFHLLNPVNHTKSPGDVRQYAGEPYVMAADVYSTDLHKGRSGWTWYTGASGWMYQAGVEWILGVRKIHERLYVRPCAPRSWKQFAVRYRYGESTYEITVLNPEGLTGEDSDQRYQIVTDGSHRHPVSDAQTVSGAQSVSGAQTVSDAHPGSSGRDAQAAQTEDGIMLSRDGGKHRVTVTLVKRPSETTNEQQDAAQEIY
ncbi:GH36-type glycosyl hydrolase domain-containing protein [Paenibacillus beijingensis]|uniref:GH36-type glycosyl hydrolase domain-containing protein n=1 Tax=Paenibacillus beijingensis TaxID=1126833 RepID=UPI0006982AC0|nr:glucoamylase family protein [Paenibacillus beijingensis]